LRDSDFWPDHVPVSGLDHRFYWHEHGRLHPVEGQNLPTGSVRLPHLLLKQLPIAKAWPRERVVAKSQALSAPQANGAWEDGALLGDDDGTIYQYSSAGLRRIHNF